MVPTSSQGGPQPGSLIGRLIDGANYAGLHVTAVLMLAVLALVMLDIAGRWAGFSLLFIANIVLVCAVWLSYAGVGHTHRLDAHVGVDTIVRVLPARARAVLGIVSELICLAVAGVALWSAWEQLSISYTYKVVMLGSFRMPLWIAQAAVPVAMLLLVLQCLKKLVLHLSGGPPPGTPSREE